MLSETLEQEREYQKDIRDAYNAGYNICKIVGKRYGCCSKIKNCARCIKKNGWEE